MSISQGKIDLAVLYKMFEDAEKDGSWVTRHHIKALFSIDIPMRRVEAATEKLFADGEIVRDYDPYNLEESRWQLSRDGIDIVERALRVPNSFIARLASYGDGWLETDEAKTAKLNKRAPRVNADTIPVVNGAEQVIDANTHVFPPIPDLPWWQSWRRDIDWTKWGTILTGIGLVVAIIALAA